MEKFNIILRKEGENRYRGSCIEIPGVTVHSTSPESCIRSLERTIRMSKRIRGTEIIKFVTIIEDEFKKNFPSVPQ